LKRLFAKTMQTYDIFVTVQKSGNPVGCSGTSRGDIEGWVHLTSPAICSQRIGM